MCAECRVCVCACVCVCHFRGNWKKRCEILVNWQRKINEINYRNWPDQMAMTVANRLRFT